MVQFDDDLGPVSLSVVYFPVGFGFSRGVAVVLLVLLSFLGRIWLRVGLIRKTVLEYLRPSHYPQSVDLLLLRYVQSICWGAATLSRKSGRNLLQVLEYQHKSYQEVPTFSS